jgi:nicotinamidase-related amidase
MASTALLIMDIQNGVVDRLGAQADGLLAVLARCVAGARGADLPVIYVRVAFREGAPEISPKNPTFAAARSGTFSESDPATQIHPSVAPEPGDIVVTKRRVSAFSGSDLDVVLRSLEVDSLVVSGIATSGVVLSTLRQAADLDFGLTVLSDGCADRDPEVHQILLDKIFPRQAFVVSSGEWLDRLPRRS